MQEDTLNQIKCPFSDRYCNISCALWAGECAIKILVREMVKIKAELQRMNKNLKGSK